jgi:hypothetical protein
MPAEPDFQAERTELEVVLSSEAFARSPIVAQMLKYICERHFRGQSHEIKEYNIAVEAFGRQPNFDQTRDSIVRVEAHRLRKRLQEYYQQQGAGHQIQIILPPGNYVPQFIRRVEPDEPTAEASAEVTPEATPEVTAEVTPEVTPESVVPVTATEDAGAAVAANPRRAATPPPPLPLPAPGARRPVSAWSWFALLILVVLGTSYIWTRAAGEKRVPSSAAATAAVVPEPIHSAAEEVRILAGSSAAQVVDHYGNTWTGDRDFQGGEERSVAPRPIANTQDPEIFYHRRQGNFAYHIPLKKGVYELRLYFAETVFGENNVGGGGETTRIFRIRANGGELLPSLDVTSDAAGSNTADIKVFKDVRPADDGMLHLEFVTLNNEVPFVNGIEIAPSQPGAIRPIRILARDSAYTDRNSRLWSCDRYFHSGVQVQRHDPVAGTDDETLYQNERFGNFSYTIPVARNGRYTVTMRFCESWFGPERPASGGGAGERLFDISFNGRILLGNFDVFKEAGSLRALDKTFKGLEPSTQGKLIFSFVPRRQYAMVDAIEVLDEGRK